jgi:hypothetical protein
MRAALYLRVSTTDQTTENQERELRAAADRLGHTIVEVYRDHGISGGKGREKRPAFDKLHRDATLRKFRAARGHGCRRRAAASAENWHLPLVLPRQRRLLRADIGARASSSAQTRHLPKRMGLRGALLREGAAAALIVVSL